MTASSTSEAPALCVGIGTSGGGLLALKALTGALVGGSGVAYLIVPPPELGEDSLLGEIISEQCNLPVKIAGEGERLRVDHLYIVPSDSFSEVEKGVIKLRETGDVDVAGRVVDVLFASLAREKGNRCAGILLLSSGSDGQAGMQAIQLAGGLTLALNPDEGKASGTDTSPLRLGVIDKVASLAECPALIDGFARQSDLDSPSEAHDAFDLSEIEFSNFAHSIPLPAWIADVDGDVQWMNERWLAYTGLQVSSMQGRCGVAVIHPGHIERVLSYYNERVGRGLEWEDTFPMRSKEGSYRWFLSTAMPIRNKEGRLLHWFGTNTDVTEKRLREASLEESETRLRLAKESRQLGIFEYNIVDGVLQWDARLRELWGVGEQAEITLETFFAGLHPDDIQKTQAAIERSLDPKSEGRYDATYRVIHAESGDLRYIRAHGTTHFEDGEPQSMFGLVEDVSEEEATRRGLARSEELLRFTLETAVIGAWELNFEREVEATVIDPEKLFENGSEIPCWSVNQWQAVVDPADREVLSTAMASARERGELDVECRLRGDARGPGRWVWLKGKKPQTEMGDKGRLFGLVIDLSRHKALEKSLREAMHRLEETDERKNEFLSILGHELRNPLAAISGSLALMKAGDVDKTELVGILNASVKTMSRLLDDLLDLRRVSENKVELQHEKLDLGAVLEQTVKRCEAYLSEPDQKITLELTPDLWISGDPVRLEQVFTNLIGNASKYSPPRSEIIIRVRAASRRVVVEVIDSGEGLSKESLERIFEPFFQVREGGQTTSGLGVGLALCRKLIAQHGGEIEAESAGPGRGSTFRVMLPVSEPPASSRDAKEVEEKAEVRHRVRVLLVDDDARLLRTTSMLLRTMNCEVGTAMTGEECLEVATSFKPEIILLDLGLPGMSGHEVAKTLRERGVSALLVALSGYSHTESREQSFEVGFDEHLAKPAGPEEFRRLLGKASERREHGHG